MSPSSRVLVLYAKATGEPGDAGVSGPFLASALHDEMPNRVIFRPVSYDSFSSWFTLWTGGDDSAAQSMADSVCAAMASFNMKIVLCGKLTHNN